MMISEESRYTDTAYEDLAVAIFLQAVKDYKWFPNMRMEITRFLKSEYAEGLSICMSIDPLIILRKLESEVVKKGCTEESIQINTALYAPLRMRLSIGQITQKSPLFPLKRALKPFPIVSFSRWTGTGL